MGTHFASSNESDWWTAQELEPDRLWKEPEVIIFAIRTYPKVSSSASAYDNANKRWYQLNIDTVFEGREGWLAKTVTKHIVDYHSKHDTLPDFNVINTTRQGSPVTFQKKPYNEVARPIEGKFRYGSEKTDILPTTTSDQIKEKIHLSCSSDRCVWQGQQCVFKRIEFSEDLAVIEREIRQREKLLRVLEETPRAGDSLETRYHILPILAVVHKDADTDHVMGLLFPYGGRDLENLAGGCDYGMSGKVDLYDEDDSDEGEPEAKEGAPDVSATVVDPSTFPRLPISEDHLKGLAMGVWELSRAGVLHGDIIDRHTLLTKDGRLVLIDLGDVAPDYKGDAYALGKMMVWACKRVDWDSEAILRVRTIAACLETIMDLEDIWSVDMS